MPENYRIFIVDDIAETRENISKLLQFEPDIEVVGSFGSGQDAIDKLKVIEPDVILMDINMPDLDGITATEIIRKKTQISQIIILSVQGDANYMRRAMLAGARDYLTKPPLTEDLVSAIRRAGDMARSERAKVIEQTTALKNVTQTSFKKMDGKLVVVFSPKGGTGVTTMAVNLGFKLNQPETPVVLVDANFQFGDVPLFINERAKASIYDLTKRADQLEPEFVKQVVAVHSRSNINFLAAPPRLEQAEEITAEQYITVLSSLRELYSYIVIDNPHIINDISLTSLDLADRIVLILTQDIAAIRNAQIFMELINSLKIPKDKITVVMNRYDKRISITAEKISSSLKIPIDVIVPLDEKVVVTSVNRGIPFAQVDGTDAVSLQLNLLANTIIEKVSQKD